MALYRLTSVLPLPMATTKLSSKGQIILPKSVRDANRWAVGTEFSVESVDEGVLLRPLRPFGRSKLEDVVGSLRRPGAKPRTIEEMDAAIAKQTRKRHASGRY